MTDFTATSTWRSTNPSVLCYVPPTAVVGGKSIPVPGNGYFLVGTTGQASIGGSFAGNSAGVLVNVVASSSTPTPAQFGNGSQGAVVISSNTDWTAIGVPGGTFFPQFTSLTVNAGVTLTVPSGLNIRCSGDATIKGKIVVAPWCTYAQALQVAGLPGQPGAPLLTARDQAAVVRPGLWGGGAGSGATGGSGGGTLGIRANNITIGTAGSIVANGGRGGATYSGGAGGVVVLVWKGAFTNQGAPGVSCAGAAGGNATTPGTAGGNGGGGGLVVLIGPKAVKPSTATPIVVNGGAAGTSISNTTTFDYNYVPVTTSGPAGSCAGPGGQTVTTKTTSSGSGAFGKDVTPTTILTYTPSAGGAGAIVATATTNVAGTVPAAP